MKKKDLAVTWNYQNGVQSANRSDGVYIECHDEDGDDYSLTLSMEQALYIKDRIEHLNIEYQGRMRNAD